MTNERLRSAISKAGLTVVELSERVQVDPKTIERWIDSGRTPHRQNRQRLALCVGADEVYLWPDAFPESQIRSASLAEVVEVYPNRGSLPASLWHSLLTDSVECIDVLAFAATFLHDTLADYPEVIADRAAHGVRVRFLLGDPESEAVSTRGREEGIGDLLAQRCRLTWTYLKPLLELPGVEARKHGSTLYASLFRFDQEVLVNHHLFGAPANHSAVTRLRRVEGGRLFDHALASFERVWTISQPVSGADLP